jgi:hypothetical protein
MYVILFYRTKVLNERFFMDTIYYMLDARRVSRTIASGEAALSCGHYAILPRKIAPRAGEMEKVLDFAAYRRALPTSEEEMLPPAHQAHPASPEKTAGVGLTMEVLATAGILVMTAAVILAFLPLL